MIHAKKGEERTMVFQIVARKCVKSRFHKEIKISRAVGKVLTGVDDS